MSGRHGLRPAVVRLVHVAAAALFGTALVHTAVDGVAEPEVALAFGCLIAVGVGIQWRTRALPGDREQAPIGAAAALAYALLGPLRGLPTSHGVLQVIAVTGLGTAVGMLPALRPARSGRGIRLDPPRTDAAARRLLAVGFAALLFQPPYNAGVIDRLHGPEYGILLTLVAGLASLCDTVIAAVLSWARTGLRFGAALEGELRALLGIGSAIVATGLLLSLLAGEVGLWALPLFCAPLLLTQASFRRAAAVRATTGQTIETLARATEVAGYTTAGHARRVADIACALGRELGLSTRELALLEYAALMHDIGQLSLVEPVPDGATALLAADEQQRIARLGSEVIRRTGVPREVWHQVARLADPCRLENGRPDRTLPVASRIIRVANAHDDLLTAARGTAGQLEVLERLRLERGRTYDPAVLDALATLQCQGRGALPISDSAAGRDAAEPTTEVADFRL